MSVACHCCYERSGVSSQTCQHMFALLWGNNRGLSRGDGALSHINIVHLREHNSLEIIVLCALQVDMIGIRVFGRQLSRIY